MYHLCFRVIHFPCFLNPFDSVLSLVPVTGSRWRAHYKVVEFQPRAEDTQTLESVLMISAITSFPLMTVVPPLSPPP